MIPTINEIVALEDYILKVIFDDGVTVLYDVKTDMEENPVYCELKDRDLFYHFKVSSGRTVVSWTDMLDLPSDIIYEYGKRIEEE